MAETVAVKTQIDIGESAKSLKDLKAEFKELQGELSKTVAGSKEYHEVLQKIGNTKDEIDDLNDAINATTGGGKLQSFAKLGSSIAGGFASAQGAMALFGAESQDLEKALLKVQSAMAISQGLAEIEGLSESFKNVKKNVLDLWKTLIANPFLAVAAALAALGIAAAAYYRSTIDTRTETEKLIDAHKLLNKQFEEQDRLLKLVTDRMRAQGKTEKEILEATKALTLSKIADMEVIVQREEMQVRAHLEEIKRLKERTILEKGLSFALELFNGALVRSEDEIMEAASKAMNEYKKSKEELFSLKTQVLQIDKDITKINVEEAKKTEERNTKLIDAELEAIRLKQEGLDHEKKMHEQFNNELKAFDDQKLSEDEARRQVEIKAIQDLEAAKIQASLDRMATEEKAEKEKEARQKLRAQASVQLVEQSLSLASAITTSFAKQDEASQKKAFDLNKKIQIALAYIDMIKATQSAFATAAANPITTVFPPYPFIQAGIAAGFGIANIHKIESMQFQGGGSGGSVSIPSGGAGTGAPLLNNTPQNTTTQINQDSGTVQGQGNKSIVKAYMVTSEATAAQEVEKKIINKNKVE